MKVLIAYYDSKMFLTLDLNVLINEVFEYFGLDSKIELCKMTKIESEQSTEEVDGYTAIRQRFLIYSFEDSRKVRHSDLEDKILEIKSVYMNRT